MAARPLEWLWTTLALVPVLLAGLVTGVPFVLMEDDGLAFAQRYMSLSERSLWYQDGDSFWGLGIYDDMGKDEPPPALQPVLASLRACGLQQGDVLAADIGMDHSSGPPWQVQWRPENHVATADPVCLRQILAHAPADRHIPFERKGALLFRLHIADLDQEG